MSDSAERIQPLILGRGAAGRALAHALALYPEQVASPKWLERDDPLPQPENPDLTLLVIATPHALHAPRLVEAAETGYRFVICEKPAAVDIEQADAIAELPIEVWICHGYRMLWGPQELRRAVAEGRFGRFISIEGRYWQSSAAHSHAGKDWKDSPELSGHFDVLLDLAIHWADLVTFIRGRSPDSASVRRWYVNAASAHRDTHVHLTLGFGADMAFGSVSKTAHGHGNTLELTLLGRRAAASWSFARPDVVVWREGAAISTEARGAVELPARPAPFHGLGWMEGYARLVGEVARQMTGGRPAEAPTLAEHLEVVRLLLAAAADESS